MIRLLLNANSDVPNLGGSVADLITRLFGGSKPGCRYPQPPAAFCGRPTSLSSKVHLGTTAYFCR